MLVCHCKAVSERELFRAIEAGACSVRALARECGAGSVCGACRPLIDELLEEHTRSASAPGLGLALAAAR